MTGVMRVGIGGWTFAPWRGAFYPKDLKQKDELAYAARALTALEINGTHYSGFKPETFVRWAAEVPTVSSSLQKGQCSAPTVKVLAEAGESIGKFFAQGIGELGKRLGPILWQFAHTNSSMRTTSAASRPASRRAGRRRLRHASEVRHESFRDQRFVDLARERGVAIRLADHSVYPRLMRATADFRYARLMRGSDDELTCYPGTGIEAHAAAVGPGGP